MKIALISPFEEPVPPTRYGGIERVVYNLAEGLVKLGHDVTVFASGGSHTSARLVKCVESPVRTSIHAKNEKTRLAQNLRGLIKAIDIIKKDNFDIVHNHLGWQTLLFKDLLDCPMVTTIHGSLDEPGDRHIYTRYKNMPFVSISNSQRSHAPNLNYVATVYNGIDVNKTPFNDKPKDYLIFLGRIHPHKGPRHAIDIAKRTGKKLIVAAKVDPVDIHYFEEVVKPHIDGKQIVYISEPDDTQKFQLLKNAQALISPIQWDEPFGIVYIEALATGTPVITIKRGSAKEIIANDRVGYLCKDVEEMIKQLNHVGKIKRSACREHVAKYFNAQRMSKGYEKVYQKVLGTRT